MHGQPEVVAGNSTRQRVDLVRRGGQLSDQHHAVRHDALQDMVRHILVGELEHGEIALHQHLQRLQHQADRV